MPVPLQDRPIDNVREEVIDKLIYNYGQGSLSLEAFERRLDIAIQSSDAQEIDAQARDLPHQVTEQYQQSRSQAFDVKFDAGQEADNETIVSVLGVGGTDRSGAWVVPREIRSLSILGGSNLDFSQAVFTSQQVTIKVFCLFGGDNIYVPENVNVVSKAFCILGGNNIDLPPVINRRQVPTLIIEGLVLFGGVNVKIKRTIRERLVSFARQVRQLVGTDK
ncbi:LiaF domain-containing protein [Bowmanella dokdonensis]|uniref:DUF1707 and DUF2154 domain-containing protein n=1 Tax=Bowmanella dokdonensis TaxID=751969 RepID=A0A939DMI1_9ALTE|nr:LiaF domain-containing protein [Bowmanella dokdonensis]MBN7825367.1 DUF1707 and DUF2154 domain-containing protein [Bowmanella dokdonensis]